MRRRRFIGVLPALSALPHVAAAQPLTTPSRLAVVHPSLPAESLTAAASPSYRALFAELRRNGFVEGTNLSVSRYTAGGIAERLAIVSQEVAKLAPNVIFTTTTPLARAMRAATATIPIVAITADPVAMGLASSLSRPGSNITGVSIDPGLEILGKRLELLRELVPGVTRLAYLSRTASWHRPPAEYLQKICETVGVTLLHAPLGEPIDESAYRNAFAAMATRNADALFAAAEAENRANARLVVELAMQARMPAVYDARNYAEAGGLLTYGIDFIDVYRLAGGSIARILGGTSPRDIPFYQPSKFELIVNLKSAKALGLTVPPSLLDRADEVIE